MRGPGALWQAGVQVLLNNKCTGSSWTRNRFFFWHMLSARIEWPGWGFLSLQWTPETTAKGPQRRCLTTLHTAPDSGSLNWDVKWFCQHTMHVAIMHRAVCACVPVALVGDESKTVSPNWTWFNIFPSAPAVVNFSFLLFNYRISPFHW